MPLPGGAHPPAGAQRWTRCRQPAAHLRPHRAGGPAGAAGRLPGRRGGGLGGSGGRRPVRLQQRPPLLPRPGAGSGPADGELRVHQRPGLAGGLCRSGGRRTAVRGPDQGPGRQGRPGGCRQPGGGRPVAGEHPPAGGGGHGRPGYRRDRTGAGGRGNLAAAARPLRSAHHRPQRLARPRPAAAQLGASGGRVPAPRAARLRRRAGGTRSSAASPTAPAARPPGARC